MKSIGILGLGALVAAAAISFASIGHEDDSELTKAPASHSVTMGGTTDKMIRVGVAYSDGEPVVYGISVLEKKAGEPRTAVLRKLYYCEHNAVLAMGAVLYDTAGKQVDSLPAMENPETVQPNTFSAKEITFMCSNLPKVALCTSRKCA